MKLITWNVAKRVERLAAQAQALAAQEPDVVALQEVTARTWPLWRAALETIGLPHAACSLDGADPARAPASRRRAGVLVAARAAGTGRGAAGAAAGERAGGGGRRRRRARRPLPNAANGWTKVDTLRAIRAGLEAGDGPRVLCGDLNTPRRELPDGTVMSFARDSHARLRPERGEPWDAGELGVVPGLREIGFTDAFRALHGCAKREPSWVYQRWGGGYRLDHVFLSPELEPVSATYHHDWRDAGLSDHSALEVWSR